MADDHGQPVGGAPDPRGTASPTEFVAQLRLLKVWAGNPPFEQLARSSGVPRSTLADALNKRGDRLPALEVVRRFVRACGVVGDDAQAWERQWRQLQAPGGPAGDRGQPVPRQLPADVAGFAGRANVIKELDAALERGPAGAVVISAVSGTAGVGKPVSGKLTQTHI